MLDSARNFFLFLLSSFSFLEISLALRPKSEKPLCLFGLRRCCPFLDQIPAKFNNLKTASISEERSNSEDDILLKIPADRLVRRDYDQDGNFPRIIRCCSLCQPYSMSYCDGEELKGASGNVSYQMRPLPSLSADIISATQPSQTSGKST